MAWKRIGNHSYYYRSRREGGRVVSEYVGRGEVATLMAQITELDRLDRDGRRSEERDEREAAGREEQRFMDWFDAVEAVANGALLAAGFHKHHGQWRRRRHGGDEPGGGGNPGDGGGQDPGKNDLG